MSTNYLAAEVPPEKDPADYSYVERRADLLDRVLAAGSRKNIHQARLAEVYDVSPAQISKDMARIGDDVADHLTNDLELQTVAMYEHTVEQLRADGRYKAAWDVHLDFLDWVDYSPEAAANETDTTDTEQDDVRKLPQETKRLMAQLTHTDHDTSEETTPPASQS
ncbi:hypothetical protein [Haladaptatus salinisoli]|uniref:hypothetical protein n=1 Tax=Haladaptatus salinisoli TaxID=2884876 RepID=UPI001D0AA879|nr:hypothetical protein [Haladaptatus salinisoli]